MGGAHPQKAPRSLQLSSRRLAIPLVRFQIAGARIDLAAATLLVQCSQPMSPFATRWRPANARPCLNVRSGILDQLLIAGLRFA
eukprot:6013073-Amphidinium_carterae.1